MLDYPLDLSNVAITVPELPSILLKIFPTWLKENISIKPVSGGITNMLIKCTHHLGHTTDVVLVRSYGDNTSLIIDRQNEFKNHLLLHKLDLAPRIYARLSNGIIYGFLSGRSLSADELSNDVLFPLIAHKLGYWHTVITRNDDPMKSNDLWDTMTNWLEIAPKIDGIDSLLHQHKDILENKNSQDATQILLDEVKWLERDLKNKSEIVKSHCDLLSGNIVIPPDLDEKNYQFKSVSSNTEATIKYGLHLPKAKDNPISFIDYEYMLFAPRGFDIANHLAEWQGFDCDKAKILDPVPSNKVLRKWCAAYLIGTGTVTDQTLDLRIDQLINEIALYFGVPGFYWGVWAAIQSRISSIDFDYALYSLNRIKEYLVWKQKYNSLL